MKPQHIGRAAGAALALSLALAGCGGADPNAAVVVGDQVVSENDVDAVMTDLSALGQSELPARSEVAGSLATSQFFAERLAQAGVVVSDDQVRRSLPPTAGAVSDEFIDYARGMSLDQELSQLEQKAATDPSAAAQFQKAQKALEEGQADLTRMLDDGSVKVNPRYDGQRPAWLQGGDEAGLVPQDPQGGQAPQAPQGEAPQGDAPAPAPSTPAG